jgi:Outer membrane protein beta-barrel domain
MKSAPFFILFWVFFGLTSQLVAQKKPNPLLLPDTASAKSDVFERKLRIGINYVQGWSTIVGKNQPFDYFTKPSLGGGGQLEYFFSKNWGFGTGFMFQQRGAGIYNPDVVKDLGNADSTHRQRLRMNCLDLPLRLEYRANKGAFSGSRWSAGLGLIPTFTFRTINIFHSVEDGFHVIEKWTPNFKKFDLSAVLSGGLNIDAAESCILQIHFFVAFGFINPYNNSSLFGNAKGNNLVIGIKAATLF